MLCIHSNLLIFFCLFSSSSALSTRFSVSALIWQIHRCCNCWTSIDWVAGAERHCCFQGGNAHALIAQTAVTFCCTTGIIFMIFHFAWMINVNGSWQFLYNISIFWLFLLKLSQDSLHNEMWHIICNNTIFSQWCSLNQTPISFLLYINATKLFGNINMDQKKQDLY